MATDYDAPRPKDTDTDEDSLERLQSNDRGGSPDVDVDEAEAAETFELPGADLSGQQLAVQVLPVQRDEFTCTSCFLVHHRSRIASREGEPLVCTDCAG